jgi:hypothetical protein
MHFRRLRDSFMSRFQILLMLPFWRSVMIVSPHFLPSLLLLMLSSQQALFPTFQLFFFLLPISSGYIPPLQCWSSTHSMSLRFCSIGFHVALASIGVFGLSLLFTSSLVPFPNSARVPTWFSVVLLLGRTDGGCSVCP